MEVANRSKKTLKIKPKQNTCDKEGLKRNHTETEPEYITKHDYVFIVYKEVDQIGSNIYGIFKTMDKAQTVQKKVAIEGNGGSIMISQIPLNLFIPSHTDYVMKVLT